MRLIKTIVAIVGGIGLLTALSVTVRADDDDDDGGWQRHEWHEHYGHEEGWRSYGPPPVVYVQPRYYEAPPVYYAPSPPGYYMPPRE